MSRRRGVATVRVRVPEAQSQFVTIDGQPYISVLWHYGSQVEAPLTDLGELIAGTRGTIVVARRLVGAKRRMFEEYRTDIGHELHARLIHNERTRWRKRR